MDLLFSDIFTNAYNSCIIVGVALSNIDYFIRMDYYEES